MTPLDIGSGYVPGFVRNEVLPNLPRQSGEGIHRGLFNLARVLTPYRTEAALEAVLHNYAAQCARRVPESEIKCRDPRRETPRGAASQPLQFDREAFRRFVADHLRAAGEEWLERRSPICPANQTPASFLRALYREGERVIIFDKLRTQGQAIWRHIGLRCDDRVLDRFAKGAQSGVWFLSNPVDGMWRPNREGKWSLRSQENVTAWPYMVLESDRSDISAGEWLAFLVALQLPIAAICETGGRLPHALLRVDAASKEGWDRIRDALAPLLIMGGADLSREWR